MAESTHRCEVVRVKLEKHPNADSLSIVRLFGGGYQVIVRTESFRDDGLAVYVPPDSLCPLDHPEFEWMKSLNRTPKEYNGKLYHRVTAIKLRKMPSMGILFPAPPDAVEGQDLAEMYGILHYEPPTKGMSGVGSKRGSLERKPKSNPPTYDLESLRRYSGLFKPDEIVYVSEKIHGANARYTFEDRGWFQKGPGFIRLGDHLFSWKKGFKHELLPWYARYIHVGSRNQWRPFDAKDPWWMALYNTPEIGTMLWAYRSHTLYGEIYGDVQDLTYGLGPGDVRFAAFDLFHNGVRKFMEPKAFLQTMRLHRIPTVPMIGVTPFKLERLLAEADGPTKLWHGGDEAKPHLREGIVVKPLTEREDPSVGRIALKVVSQQYLERQE